MKLKNLFIAVLAVCACVSCAKDAEKGSAPSGKKDAKLSVKTVTTKASTGTSTDKNELPGEAKINDLTAFIFNEEGTELFAMQRKTAREGEEVDAVEGIETTSFENISLVLVANSPIGVLNDISTVAELQAKLANLSAQNQENLTMSSPVITTETYLYMGENYIGYGNEHQNMDNLSDPIVLTRIAARISLVGTKTKFAGTELEGRTVSIDSIYLANVKATSKYFSIQDWGSVETNTGLVYDAKAAGTTDRIAAGSTAVDYLHAAIGKEVSDNSPANQIIGSLYTFENTLEAMPTILIMRATLLANDSYKAETRYFPIVINPKGSTTANHELVKRNYVYKIRATITDKSFTNDPANAALDLKVTVAEWGVVNQDVDIE